MTLKSALYPYTMNPYMVYEPKRVHLVLRVNARVENFGVCVVQQYGFRAW